MTSWTHESEETVHTKMKILAEVLGCQRDDEQMMLTAQTDVVR
jgi:hypothetical protein